MTELVPRLIDLARRAMNHDLNFTVDAEEADRLELSLEVIAAAFGDASFKGWDGFGLAIQAYQKRAAAVIGYSDELARALNRRMMLRLVKGAYWDTEIKRAQERGLDDYPVFTRKAMTDLNYIACAQQLLALRPRIFPQFATHNALTVATVLELADGTSGFEFQRLHGMGEALYAQLERGSSRHRLSHLCAGRQPPRSAGLSGAAPAGERRQFVVRGGRRRRQPCRSRRCCAARPTSSAPPPMRGIRTFACRADLYRPQRQNSRGIEFGERAALSELVAAIAAETTPAAGSIADATPAGANAAIAAAREGFKAGAGRRRNGARQCSNRPPICWSNGARISSRCCNAKAARPSTMRFPRSARPSISAATTPREGRKLFGEGEPLPGPTGESNVLRLRGRGVFVAISPWNFPLAIFLGQVAAALMAGNAVVAKPAEQTPLIAAEAVRLLHQAGVPASALHLVPGDGSIGAALVAHPDVAGVVFTGSTEVARSINRALAAKDGPIVPLIAETGGINAMIVDATALPEQVADDVVTSAFRSAGQRCSALRLLFVQDDVADRMIEMIAGAARELRIGDPRDLATHVGPVIDAEAKQRLEAHIARMKKQARVHFAGAAPAGNYVAPHIFELSGADQLTEEVFGPVLHVVRYPADRLDARAAVDRALRLRADARHSFAHRRHGRGGDRPAGGRQHLRQPQHDRRRGRRAAVRRPWPVGHRSQGRRAALSGALRDRTDRDDQYGGGGRQCGADVGCE